MDDDGDAEMHNIKSHLQVGIYDHGSEEKVTWGVWVTSWFGKEGRQC